MIFPPNALMVAFAIGWISETSSQPRNFKKIEFETDCGFRPGRRGSYNSFHLFRSPKIIAGTNTKEGQFPWQASLELLHPSMGFLGHWCGGVLIHEYWVLSAAHCVHNDLFNLPIPPLWTVVLGEHDRTVETGLEQRIPVEKIVLHENYENFMNDLVLMKLSMRADLSRRSVIRRICLPFATYEHNSALMEVGIEETDALEIGIDAISENTDNFLRSAQNFQTYRPIAFPSMQELMTTKILSRIKHYQLFRPSRTIKKQKRRRNDKLMRTTSNFEKIEYTDLLEQKSSNNVSQRKDLPYFDCVATGWGKANITGDLTDLLLKTAVPLHNNKRCKDAYGGFVKIHRGHLCAGKLNGKSGTCVGDSGGPLQCRLSKNGPWTLAGITSFGSGCAIEGFPDVYTRTSHYMKWIQDTIAQQ